MDISSLEITLLLTVTLMGDLILAVCVKNETIPCHNMNPCLSVKNNFDINLFLGLWFQIGVYKHGFGAAQSHTKCWYKEFKSATSHTKTGDLYENVIGSFIDGLETDVGRSYFTPVTNSSLAVISNSMIRPKGGKKWMITEYILETDYRTDAIIYSCLCNKLYQLKVYSRSPVVDNIYLRPHSYIYNALRQNNLINDVTMYDAGKICSAPQVIMRRRKSRRRVLMEN